MFGLAERRHARAASHIGVILLIGAGVAGCSADATRFNDGAFASPYATRNTSANTLPNDRAGWEPVNRAVPAARVDSQQLPPPPRSGSSLDPTPGRDLTGSVPVNTPAASRSSWQWDGGTAITVNHGDTLDSISHHYGVPVSAIMQANNITAPASIQPGQNLVIPRYSYTSGGPHSVPPQVRVAANSTMVPVAVGSPGLARSNVAPPVNRDASNSGTHIVGRGETLSLIAHRYHKPRRLIAKLNNIEPDAKVRIGQHLVIPGAKPNAPAMAAIPLNRPQPNGPAPRTTAETNAKPPGAPPVNSKIASGPPANAHMAMPEPATETPAPAAPEETTGGTPSFRWPVRGRIIAGFGPKTNGQQNDGIDLSVPEGTSIKAAEDGVVAYAGNELKGYGNLVLVRHSNGFVTAYAHASELMVKRGDQVKRGQVIGRSGQTGSVSSPQLHFEIRKGASPVDPTQYLAGT